MRVLIAAGGTGGHLYPAVALVQNLKGKIPNLSILWIGGTKDLERRIVEKENIQFKSITVTTFPRSLSLKWALFILKTVESLIRCFTYMLVFKPEVVVGMGSFHSYPVVLSAFLFQIPAIVCEQNVSLSLTNKMLLPFVGRIALSFPGSVAYLPAWARKKAVVTGNPVREKVITTSRRHAIGKLHLMEEKFTLLFLGGSQGAHYLNKTAMETLELIQKERWAEDIQFILITGEKDYSWVKEQLHSISIKGKIFPYLSEMHRALAASDLVVARSGATTIAEITARGLPCILIPYPFATKQHQLSNALFLENEGGAKVIVEKKLQPSLLKTTIKQIIHDPHLRDTMRKASQNSGKPEAAENIVDLVLHLEKR